MLLAALVSLVPMGGHTIAEDTVTTTLGAARAKYRDASRQARTKLMRSLERAANTAQRTGDLTLLQSIRQEQAAFIKSRKLPGSVSTDRYEKELQTAQTRMQKAYETAVSAFTRAGQIDRAGVIQAELDAFLTGKLGPPEDAAVFRGTAYKVFSQNLTWDAARLHCERLGGTLAEISSSEENQFLLNLAQRAKLDSVWLGATDQKKEGQWTWLSGRTPNYSNWGPGQPNNKQSAEHYLIMIVSIKNRPALAGSWSDQPVKSSQHKPGFVCQWD